MCIMRGEGDIHYGYGTSDTYWRSCRLGNRFFGSQNTAILHPAAWMANPCVCTRRMVSWLQRRMQSRMPRARENPSYSKSFTQAQI